MHIEDLFEEKARKGDGSFAIAYALMQIAEQQKSIAYQIGRLGLGDAASPHGALELLGMTVSESAQTIADALGNLAPD